MFVGPVGSYLQAQYVVFAESFPEVFLVMQQSPGIFCFLRTRGSVVLVLPHPLLVFWYVLILDSEIKLLRRALYFVDLRRTHFEVQEGW